MKQTLGNLAALMDAKLSGDADYRIQGVASVEEAGPAHCCFMESAKLAEKIKFGQAGAIVVGPDFPELPGRNLLRVENPRLAFLKVMELFARPPAGSGIHHMAWIDPDAELGEGVSLGPNSVVQAGCRVGRNTWIGGGAYLGEKVTLGEDCLIEPNVTLLDGVTLGNRCIVHSGAVIGGDGFGFQWLGDHHHKVPQLGIVIIEDDVEIGCNTCIDRATLGTTRIGAGSKIDNLVQVAHNDQIGRHVVLAGHISLAGSVTLEDGVVMGGHSAVADHVKIGAGTRLGGKTGVIGDLKPGSKVWGTPARPIKQVFREQAAVGKLPDLLKTVKQQQKELDELRERLARLEQLE